MSVVTMNFTEEAFLQAPDDRVLGQEKGLWKAELGWEGGPHSLEPLKETHRERFHM